MKYLKLETCKLLEKLGCTSESGKIIWGYPDLKYPHIEIVDNDEFENLEYTSNSMSAPAFTWDDICTKENAIKIWGKDDKELRMSFEGFYIDSEGNTDNSVDDAESIKYWRYKLGFLLDMKLNGEDWEAKLLEVPTPPKE